METIVQSVCHLQKWGQSMRNKKQLTPWLMLSGILAVLGIIAGTDIMDTVIRFIHTDQGSSYQLAATILVGILGFRLAYVLLDTICSYYSDRFDERINKANQSKL
jgi:prolipoprotein diacylglyceryltransferase